MRYCNKDDIVCIDYLGTVRYRYIIIFFFLVSVYLFLSVEMIVETYITYLRKKNNYIGQQVNRSKKDDEEQRVWSMRGKNAQEIFGLLNKFSFSYVRSGVSFFFFLFSLSLCLFLGNKSSWDNCWWSERVKLALTFIGYRNKKKRKGKQIRNNTDEVIFRQVLDNQNR